MTKFSDLGIKPSQKGFTGEKIKISKVLNREILVEDFKIEESKFPDKGNCLHLQITVNATRHVVFTGSTGLIEQIQQVPKDKFPFTTVIIEDNDRFSFT